MELQTIQNKIHEIRGQKVMLDFDLAEMYGIETRVLKQAVRRNPKRFEGNDFMFELTKEELSRSQFVTLNKGRGNNFKYMPFAFTELGVAMLSSVLNSDIAIEINRNIMRAFVAIRNYT
ncbi:ORF6N domain-containing protein, partial [Parabacteroides sp. AM25-14]